MHKPSKCITVTLRVLSQVCKAKKHLDEHWFYFIYHRDLFSASFLIFVFFHLSQVSVHRHCYCGRMGWISFAWCYHLVRWWLCRRHHLRETSLTSHQSEKHDICFMQNAPQSRETIEICAWMEQVSRGKNVRHFRYPALFLQYFTVIVSRSLLWLDEQNNEKPFQCNAIQSHTSPVS